MPDAENDAAECPTCWGDGYIDHDLGRESCTACVTPSGVGA